MVPSLSFVRYVLLVFVIFVLFMFTMAQETGKSCSRLSSFSCRDLIRRITCSSLSDRGEDAGEDAKVSHFLNSADPTFSEPGTGYKPEYTGCSRNY